ncbi:hypothetical protein ABZ829_27830 [Streptomyces xanthochromogenes]|uniref:hypothetical protein n=1 Tax=Streptomyces xanthochromogenes TaxID=67384 RepID=UPI003430B1F5
MVAAVMLGLGAAACGGGGGDGKASSPEPSGSTVTVSASTSASPSGPAVSVQDALANYNAASAAGCQTADDCHFLMVRRLAASEVLASSMKATDPAAYAEPIRLQNAAEQQADHFGRDSLGAKGNYAAVDAPLRQMANWFGEHPGM